MESQRGVVLSSIRAGDDANAVSELEKLISDFAENENIARAVREVADEYRELGRYDEALANYGYVVQTWPGTEQAMEAQSGKVLAHISGKDYSAADAALNVLISKYSKGQDIEKIVKEIAGEYRELDKNAKAIEAYKKVVENWPGSDEAVESQTYVAKLYISASDDANAELAVEKLVAGFAKEDKVVEGVMEAAEEYGNASKHDKAGELYRRIVETWPDREEALWTQMGVVTSRLRAWDLDGAEAELGRLLTEFETNERLSDAVHEIVEEYRNTGAHEEGRQLFGWLLENRYSGDKTMLELQVGIALQSIKLGELDKADPAVEKLIGDYNDNPELAKALFQIGEEYYHKGLSYRNDSTEAKCNFAKAIAVWERVIVQQSAPSGTTVEAYYYLAACHRRLGEYEKAILYYENVISTWPGYKRVENAQFSIGYCYERLRDLGKIPESEADVKIEEAHKALVEKYPDSGLTGKALLGLARLNFKRGQWAEAAWYFRSALKKYPENRRPVHALYSLGKAYEELGQLDKALEVYEDFINSVPSFDPRIETVKARLKELAG
jgi:tetratricopeptide (TPR) repeat protein